MTPKVYNGDLGKVIISTFIKLSALAVLIVMGMGTAYAVQNVDPCNPPKNATAKDAICSKTQAADFVFWIAGGINNFYKKCSGLDKNNQLAWDSTILLWTRRNLRWLNAATQIETNNRENEFNWKLNELLPYRRRDSPNAGECRDAQEDINKGNLDIDISPHFRVVEPFLQVVPNSTSAANAVTDRFR